MLTYNGRKCAYLKLYEIIRRKGAHGREHYGAWKSQQRVYLSKPAITEGLYEVERKKEKKDGVCSSGLMDIRL